jgi:hypothetical protein
MGSINDPRQRSRQPSWHTLITEGRRRRAPRETAVRNMLNLMNNGSWAWSSDNTTMLLTTTTTTTTTRENEQHKDTTPPKQTKPHATPFPGIPTPRGNSPNNTTLPAREHNRMPHLKNSLYDGCSCHNTEHRSTSLRERESNHYASTVSRDLREICMKSVVATQTPTPS